MGLKALTAEIYSRVQQHLLPPGITWKRDGDGELTKVLLATGDELARVSQRGVDLIDEADPRTTDELLTDFETALGLDGLPVDVSWRNLVSVEADGNTIEKTAGGAGFNAGGFSKAGIEGDGYAEWTIEDPTGQVVCGLGLVDSNQGRGDVDFAIYQSGAINTQIYEVTQKAIIAVVTAPGDLLRVQRDGTTITYYHNGDLIYESLLTSTGTLFVDSSIFTVGAKVVDAVIQSTELRRAAIIARMVEQQRARPVDFQEALASILGQASGDVVVIETSRAQAVSQNDAKEIYRFFIYRDPTEPGTYDIVAAQTEIDRIAHSHTKGHAIESIAMIVDDPFSLVDRDIIGV